MAAIRFTTDLGVEVLVQVEGESAQETRRALWATLREYGRYAWRAVPVPPGGLRFPLASEPDFDWTLLGARRGTCTIGGEERDGVWHDGKFYTRRELAPNPRMKLGGAVKYSRGARHADPPEVVEGADGDFRYVTLALFRGEGRRREAYAIPAEEASEPPGPAGAGIEPAEPGQRGRARPPSSRSA